MTRTVRLTREHIDRFAEASGDRNPLHVDETFARTTPYGQPIVHGALVAIAALGAVDQGILQRLRTLHLQFKNPVLPGDTLTVEAAAEAAKTRVSVAVAGRTVAMVTLTSDADLPSLDGTTAAPGAGPPNVAPQRHAIDALAADGFTFQQPYAADLAALSALAAALDSSHVPPAVLGWLAAASYTVGMIVPGVDAVFADARITRATELPPVQLSGTLKAADDRTGLTAVEAVVAAADAGAKLELTAFLRPPVPPPSRTTIAEHLEPSDVLSEWNVLVVGGSRGLGATLAGAFATQGATVWAGYESSHEHAAALATEFGEDRIRPLQLDASDAASVQRALSGVATEAGSLDGLVLAAAPPLFEAPLVPGAADAIVEFVRESVALLVVPLAAAQPLLSPSGFVAVVSSPVVGDPPELWPHYTIAKSAAEGLAEYCRRHLPVRVLVARPPKLWTDSTNTPLGRLGTTSKEQVAAAIVRWVTNDEAGAVLAPEDLLAPRSAT